MDKQRVLIAKEFKSFLKTWNDKRVDEDTLHLALKRFDRTLLKTSNAGHGHEIFTILHLWAAFKCLYNRQHWIEMSDILSAIKSELYNYVYKSIY